MNKNFASITKRPFGVIALALLGVASLSACTQQKALLLSQTELSHAQACLSKQEVQGQQLSQQQGEILLQLQQVQQQLVVQQQAIEAKPQVVERIEPKIYCPNTQVAPSKRKKAKVQSTEKQIVGLREQALVAGLNVVMQAKISTSVANSVVDARNIQMFERNGDEWVRFTIYNPETKEPHVLERKRVRFQTVTGNGATPDRRPVVEIRFTIGKLSQKGEFILSDRSSSEYPILIGRNLLRDVMLVDVSGNNLAPLQRPDDNNSVNNTKSSPAKN